MKENGENEKMKKKETKTETETTETEKETRSAITVSTFKGIGKIEMTSNKWKNPSSQSRIRRVFHLESLLASGYLRGKDVPETTEKVVNHPTNDVKQQGVKCCTKAAIKVSFAKKTHKAIKSQVHARTNEGIPNEVGSDGNSQGAFRVKRAPKVCLLAISLFLRCSVSGAMHSP